jgi:hypothetical protein
MKTFSLCVFLSLIVLIAGCGNRKNHPQPSPPSHQQEATEFRTDSFKFASQSRQGRCEIFLDYPVQDGTPAAIAVKDYIKATLFDNSASLAPDEPEAITKAYCEQTLERLGKTLDQMGIKHVDEESMPEEGIEIRMVYQSRQVVTYEIYRYSYLTNGPHGEYAEYGVSFRRSDGKRMGSDIIQHTDEAFNTMIREGLRQYFDITSDQQLQEICTVDIKEPPMPTFPPYFVGNGIRFHYSIYDVCEFDDGDPSFTIPYERIAPYLSEEAAHLLP